MRTYILIILFSYSFFNFLAQEKVFANKDYYLVDSLVLEELSESDLKLIDSCLIEYHKTKVDSLKWNAINYIASVAQSEIWYEYQKIATNIVENKLKQKLSEEERNDLLSKKASNLNNEGYWLGTRGYVDKANLKYEEAINIQKKVDPDGNLANKISNLANNYYQQGKIYKAKLLYEESILNAKRNKEKKTAKIIANLAMVYNSLGRNDEALMFLNQALEYEKINPSKLQKALIYTDLGVVYLQKFNNYDTSIYFYNKSLAIYEEEKSIRLISSTSRKLGEVYLSKDLPDTTKALAYLNTSLEKAKEVSNLEEISVINYILSEVYFNRQKIDSALTFAKKANEYAIIVNTPKRIQSASLILSKIFTSKKEYKKAYYFNEKYQNVNDSLNSEDNTNALADMEAKLQYESEKEIEALKHKSELKIEEKEKEKQTLYKQFFITGSIFLALIIGFIAIQLYKSIKQKKEIQATNLKLEKQHEEITSSIVYAQRIQNAILPPIGALQEVILNSFVAYQPKDIVSGDFYWIEQSKNNIHLAVADCTGHGVPGAMVSVICNNGLNRSVREFQLKKTNEILDKTREIVLEEFEKSGEEIKDGMDISLISIDFESKKMQFSGANNPVWIIREQKNEIELIELKGDKQPIGNYQNAFPFTSKEFNLIKGDSIYLSSDGYADQFGGEKNKKIKTANFKKLLIELNSLEMNIQQEKLQDFFDDWKGENEQLDDVCVVGLRI